MQEEAITNCVISRSLPCLLTADDVMYIIFGLTVLMVAINVMIYLYKKWKERVLHVGQQMTKESTLEGDDQ